MNENDKRVLEWNTISARAIFMTLVFSSGRWLLKAKRDSDEPASDSDRGFNLGRLMALPEAVSLMQQHAEAFNISLAEIGLADIDPEKDLL